MKLFYKHTQTEDTMLKKNILFTLLLSTAVFATGCKDELEITPTPDLNPNESIVTFQIGVEDSRDAYTAGSSATNRSASTGLDANLVASTQGRSAGLKPQKLYNLYMIQFKDGVRKQAKQIGTVDPGSTITTELSNYDDCQLLFIALGNGQTQAIQANGTSTVYLTANDLDGSTTGNQTSLSDYQQLLANHITALGTDETNQTDVDKQPYVLFLPHVKVSGNTIQSPDIDSNGTGHDVRILLKRLAAKLTLKWTFADVLKQEGYTLKEVRLSQVSGTIPNGKPNHATGRFYFYPARESNDTYPTAEKEYVDYFRLKDTELSGTKGSYSIWMPANVRGTSAKVTAPQHRNKDNAPEGACFVEFVAEKEENNEVKDRLTYRVYLGGAAVNDFNIKENTNYTWDVTMNSTNVADPRITRLDMTPVTSKVQKNTSNCFMVIPGTDFYFNPYKHEAGTKGWNDELVNSPSSDSPTKKTEITSVKVLWQSRDNGTSGELVLGRYISTDKHENLVNGENLGDINDAKVFVKVPVSKGGNAVIAAYHDNGNGTETILWSWHLWITDYVPERMNAAGGDVDARYKAAQSGTKNGTVHKYRSAIWKTGTYASMVMMDRNLGARKGGYPGLGKGTEYQVYTAMDGVNRQGVLYQWGRKDPFFSSADGSTTEINVIYDGDGTPLSITKIGNGNLANSIKNPLTFYTGYTSASNSWNVNNNNTAPGKKTIYDPSPEGWKVPMNGTTPAPSDLLNNGTGIYAKLGNVATTGTGNGYDLPSNRPNNLELTDATSYFTNARIYSGDQFYKNEKTCTYTGADPKGGRIFFLADNISDTPSSWTIENTVWIPVSAERSPDNGNLGAPSYGHLWLAERNSTNAAFLAILKMQIQLGFYNAPFGWSVRCIQDNK